jgi:hypothetical protein
LFRNEEKHVCFNAYAISKTQYRTGRRVRFPKQRQDRPDGGLGRAVEMTGASDSETADILAGHWWGTQHFCGFDERMGACPLSAEHACLFSSCFGPSREHNALNMITIRCQQSGPVALLWFANLS